MVDGRRDTLDPAEMIMSSANFDVVTLRSGDEYKETISLTIKKFKPSDEGTYTCTSTNSLGKKESTVRLYGKLRKVGFTSTVQRHPTLISPHISSDRTSVRKITDDGGNNYHRLGLEPRRR